MSTIIHNFFSSDNNVSFQKLSTVYSMLCIVEAELRMKLKCAKFHQTEVRMEIPKLGQ